MEALKEALLSRNILAWGMILLLVVLILRLLKNATKGLFILVAIFVLIYLLYRFFPGVVAPLVDFVKGGWLGEQG